MKLIRQELSTKEKIIAFILRKFIVLLFSIQRHMAWFKLHNYQDKEPAIYALWHAHQCSIFGLKNRKNTKMEQMGQLQKNSKMTVIIILVITLNVNGLNSLI